VDSLDLPGATVPVSAIMKRTWKPRLQV